MWLDRVYHEATGERIQLPKYGEILDFASNDYLGLSSHPAIREAAESGIRELGVGSQASRLITGSLKCFQELETRLASWKKKEASLLFNSGYQMGVSLIPAIADKSDTILADRLSHACLIDGMKSAGCRWSTFRHNDLNDLNSKLTEAAAKKSEHGIIFVITEAVFSMDGDWGKLREIVDLKKKHKFILIVDEAHSGGLLGKHGEGLAHELGIESAVDIWLGTGGKAMGVSGGFVCGSSSLIEWLTQKSRGWVFSTAPPPMVARALTRAIDIISSEEGDQLRRKLNENLNYFTQLTGIPTLQGTPIIPVPVGDESAAIAARESLMKSGCLTGAIRYPTVPKHQARLRITIKATHSRAAIKRLADSLIQGGLTVADSAK